MYSIGTYADDIILYSRLDLDFMTIVWVDFWTWIWLFTTGKTLFFKFEYSSKSGTMAVEVEGSGCDRKS